MSYGAQDVSLVVLCLSQRAKDFWADCLTAINALDEQPYEIIAVPSGPYYAADGSLLRGFYSLALNEHVALARRDLLCVINVDTLPQPGWLSAMAREFDDSDVAVAGCKLVRPDGSLQHAGVTVQLNGLAGAEEVRDDLPTRDVEAVTGACCLIRKSVFDELGGWDPEFDMGYEDIDFMLRVRRAGYRIRYVRESVVLHHESAVGSADGTRWRSLGENIARFQELWATH
jgi:O-antigen biosynthesis protein